MRKRERNQERPTNAIFLDGSAKRSSPLAIHPEAIGVAYPTREIRDRKTWELREIESCDVAEIVDGVAVLCVDGPLEHKSDGGWFSYWQTYEELASDFDLLMKDASIEAVVLKFDSPGGECAGLNETVAIMQRMKAKAGKPVIAYVDEACYSAAYALAMVADEIYLPESGGVGSIGVITAMHDVTKMHEKAGVRVEVIASGSKKTDGHPAVALTDGAIKRTRRTVDKLAASFFDLVSAGRGLTTETIAGYQAGTFTGEDAVDAGLADGVMSLRDCLTFTRNAFSSSRSPTDRSSEKEEPPMSRQIADAKALSDANRALAVANAAMTAAKTDGDRALAAARIVAAEEVVAKVKKTKTVTTDTHEEEVDDGEDDKSDAGSDSGDDDDDDSSDGGSSSSDAEEYKGDNATTGLHTKDRLLRLAREITGKKSIEEVMGALHATWQNSKRTAKLASKVATLEADAERTKVAALIASGTKAGKLSPTMRGWAKTQTPAALKAFLDVAPKMVHGTDDELTESRVEGGAAQHGAVTAEMAKIWRKLGHAEADFPALLAKMNAPKNMNGAS